MNSIQIKNYLQEIGEDKFIYHSSDSDWGWSVMVMEKSGKAFARTYYLNETNNTIYFDWLSVDDEYRKKGLATELLNQHIKTAEYFNLESMLWVDRNSWKEEWYKRKGYVYYSEYNYKSVWMIKK
jgi:GNAT superfamily N-acetyltransferase